MTKTILSGLLSIGLLTVSLNSIAQNSDSVNELLKAKFTQAELDGMKSQNADEYAFWSYFVTDGFMVFDISKDKADSEMTTIDFDGDPSTINPLSLGLEPMETSVQTFRLGNSDKGLMIYSQKKISAKMNSK